MKRFFAALLIAISLFSLAGCNHISINYDGNATLNFSGKAKDDNTELTQILTEEESLKVKTYLSNAKYTPGQGGCPFDESISITFGNQIFAIAYDDCPGVWLPGTDKYYKISEEGRNYIVSLFEKYVGYFPYP
jgi:hypothetical protein